MVKITKEEKMAVLKIFPHAHIRRTMRNKSKRHNYYCEESEKVMRFLRTFQESRTLLSEG